MADSNNKPRWAGELSDQQWSRLNDLIDDGFSARQIARQVKLPDSKLRSLQVYARKQGPRRRLTRFAEFKDALLSNVEEFGGEFSRALSTIAAMAVSPETDPKLQVRAMEAMNKFTYVLGKMMEGDAAAEKERKREEQAGGGAIDPNEAVARILEHYGVSGKKA